MATSPDAKVINRESNKMSLAARYLSSQKAGGAFDAYAATTNTAILGLQAPYGYTQKSTTLTINPGFKTNINGENFNAFALNNDKATVYKQGFNSNKYLNNSFIR